VSRVSRQASSDFLHVALAPDDKEPLERLAALHGGRSKAVRHSIKEADARTNPLRSFIGEYHGLELGYLIGSGGSGDSPERGKVLAFVYKLLDTHLPDWMERREDAAGAAEAGDEAPLILFTMTIRRILENAAQLAEATGVRPWEMERDVSGDIMRDRQEHPEHWVPIAEAARAYKALAEGHLKPAARRAPRARKKRSRTARSSARSGDSGDDGGGGEPHELGRGAP
jgi:hypothetical protein